MLLSKERGEEIHRRLSLLFNDMIQTLYSLKGAEFHVEILAKPEVQEFIGTHVGMLDLGFSRMEVSGAVCRRLTRSDYIFSGMKAFYELDEAFPPLLDENGNRKPSEQFLNDVRKIDSTYNGDYLRAEYNFVQSLAQMVIWWKRFTGDDDRCSPQYRTAADGKVRPTHATLYGVTSPITDPFWEKHYPPNEWNCCCTAVRVRKSKYPETPYGETMALGEEALQKSSKGIFHFDAGKERRSMPGYDPYTVRRCRDCDVPKGKLKLVFALNNELCATYKILYKRAGDREKTQRAIEHTHHLHRMKPLLEKSETLNTNGTDVHMSLSVYDSRYLFSDTFGWSSILQKGDPAPLDEVLRGAGFMDDAALMHPRTNDVKHFYYFRVQVRGQ